MGVVGLAIDRRIIHTCIYSECIIIAITSHVFIKKSIHVCFLVSISRPKHLNSNPLMSKYDRDPEFKQTPIQEDYEIRWNRSLGTGVSGPVRLCVNRKTGTEYALKVLLDRSDRKKAELEAILHWRCSGGDHMVRIVDVYRNEIKQPGEVVAKKRILLVLELMTGGELFTFISKRHHFTEKEASRYIMQIARAIQFCHRLNIAHRDIKPENLLLAKETDDPSEVDIKLADFGFAKIDNGDLKTPQFTPYYVAPQVLEAQKRQRDGRVDSKARSPYFYDKSCDIWSLGVIVYIMLCGYPPFYSEVPHQALSNRMKQKIMQADFDFPDNDWKDVSVDAKDLIKKMLCVEASERLAIDEVMGHPWFVRNTSPTRDLDSPLLISDLDTLQKIQDTHAEFLQSFRRDDSGFFLKPIGLAKNPVLHARMKKNSVRPQQSGLERDMQTSPANEAMESLKKLQDICFMPPPPHAITAETQADTMLIERVKDALKFNQTNAILSRALEIESWNGVDFNGLVNRKRLALSLQELVEPIVPPVIVIEN